jgi:hypothetical protein
LLREAMKKRQVDQLFTTMDKLATLEPELTDVRRMLPRSRQSSARRIGHIR